MIEASNAKKKLLRHIFDAAVAAAHPARFLAKSLPSPPASGRLIMLAAGKAAGSMIQVAEAHYLDALGLSPDRLKGHGVARIGYATPTRLIPVIEAGHPVPNQASLAAAREALHLAGLATADDLVVVLLSGGASANWLAPSGNLTLAEKQLITLALLRSGAAIGEMNIVRKHLSRIKGGRLALACAPAQLVTLAISDVPGDEPSAIGSGPTVPDPSTLADARKIILQYKIKLPENAVALLSELGEETPKPGHPAFQSSQYQIVSRPDDAIAAAAHAARLAGYKPIILGANLEGEARDVASAHAKLALELKTAGGRIALISGGELTVTIRGQGRGGPNQEYALALAVALNGARGISAVSGDTDGTDGGAGLATDPAGAFVDANTLSKAMHLKIDAKAYLEENDSTQFFSDMDDLLTPGPTLTNVNDCRVILIDPT